MVRRAVRPDVEPRVSRMVVLSDEGDGAHTYVHLHALYSLPPPRLQTLCVLHNAFSDEGEASLRHEATASHCTVTESDADVPVSAV